MWANEIGKKGEDMTGSTEKNVSQSAFKVMNKQVSLFNAPCARAIFQPYVRPPHICSERGLSGRRGKTRKKGGTRLS